MSEDIILKYFPNLSAKQQEQFRKLGPLYAEWNSKINVISRRDIECLYEHHVLHSLAIALAVGQLPDGCRILDVGTGGGFPGIPLAIVYPNVHFHLIDSIGKKIRVAQSVAQSIGLENATMQHINAADDRGSYHYVVSRGVMKLAELSKLVRQRIVKDADDYDLQPGIICLKGGNLAEELEPFGANHHQWRISDYFSEPYFEKKSVVHVW